jgi:hypothetical protein
MQRSLMDSLRVVFPVVGQLLFPGFELAQPLIHVVVVHGIFQWEHALVLPNPIIQPPSGFLFQCRADGPDHSVHTYIPLDALFPKGQ